MSSDAYRDIIVERQEAVAILRLNRPQAFNAMTVNLLEELTRAFDAIAADHGVRAVVLTGNGKAFCAGADLAATLADMPRDGEGRPDLGVPLEHYYNPLLKKIRALPQPLIAAVNGIAAGGGSSLALGADLTIAARSASFAQVFVNVALAPDVGGHWALARALGPQRAMAAALLGETIPAQLACERGLIARVVDDAALLDEALAMARQLAASPRTAVSAIKQGIRAACDNSFDAQLALEIELQRRCGQSPDFVEALRAFAEKRKPVFE